IFMSPGSVKAPAPRLWMAPNIVFSSASSTLLTVFTSSEVCSARCLGSDALVKLSLMGRTPLLDVFLLAARLAGAAALAAFFGALLAATFFTTVLLAADTTFLLAAALVAVVAGVAFLAAFFAAFFAVA